MPGLSLCWRRFNRTWGESVGRLAERHVKAVKGQREAVNGRGKAVECQGKAAFDHRSDAVVTDQLPRRKVQRERALQQQCRGERR